MRRDGPERTRRTGRTRTPLLAASAEERGAGPLANYARRAGPLHSAVHPFLRLKLGPGPLGRSLHQHLGRRGGHGPRRPHRRGPVGDLLGSAGSDGALYRERNRHHGEILRQTPAPALRQRPGSTGRSRLPENPHVLPRRREQPPGRSTRPTRPTRPTRRARLPRH